MNNSDNLDNNVNNTATPYRASSGNLNTNIGSDRAYINNPQDVNIQNNKPNEEDNLQYMDSFQMITPDKQDNTYVDSYDTIPNDNSDSSGTKTYVTMDNKPKKKSVSLNFGSEFVTAMILVFIIFVFILFLPTIARLFH